MDRNNLQAGDVLNNSYRVVKKLGQGGLGAVYHAVGIHDHQNYAIKVIISNGAITDQEEQAENLRREANALSSVQHRSVVRYFGLYSAQDSEGQSFLFLVMAYVNGPSLAELIEHGRKFSESELRQIGAQISDGLAAAHAQKITHCDISPDNILFANGDLNKGATLIDFGISTDYTGGETVKTQIQVDFAGKCEYAAPEQFEGGFVAQSDFYSLGITLLHAAGVPPLRLPFVQQLAMKNKPLKLEGSPKWLQPILQKICAVKVKDRPQSAEIVAQLFRGKQEQTPKPSTSRLQGIVLALLVIVAAALVYFQVNKKEFISPYKVNIELMETFSGGDFPLLLQGHAPDADVARAWSRKIHQVLGRPLPDEQAPLAFAIGTGEAEQLEFALQDAMDVFQYLEYGRLQNIDKHFSVTGTVKECTNIELIEQKMDSIKTEYQFDTNVDLRCIGIEPEKLAARLNSSGLTNCGDLIITRASKTEAYRVMGYVERDIDKDALEHHLQAQLGDLPFELAVEVLNGPLCNLNDVLPAKDSEHISLSIGNFTDSELVLTNEHMRSFAVGEKLAIFVDVPEAFSDHFLHTVIVTAERDAGVLFPTVTAVGRVNPNLAMNTGSFQPTALGNGWNRYAMTASNYQGSQFVLEVSPPEIEPGRHMVVAILLENEPFMVLSDLSEQTDAAIVIQDIEDRLEELESQGVPVYVSRIIFQDEM